MEKPETAPKSRIKAFFNDMAARPKRNYTLGEAFQHFVQKKPYSEINDNVLQFSGAGRMVERAHMAAGVLSGVLIVSALPASLLTFGVAAAVMGLYKVQGIAGGKLADLAVRGSLRAPRAPTDKATAP